MYIDSYLHWPVNGLEVLHNISTPLLQFGEVYGEAQSETQAGAGQGIVKPHHVATTVRPSER